MEDIHWILMGDIIHSGSSVDKYGLSATQLQGEFRELVGRTNDRLDEKILSPLTITLGDEFQGLMETLKGAPDALFFLEEEKMRMGFVWQLRYVLHEGEIQSEINREAAYGMIGPGLTRAREVLSSKGRRNRPRFQFLIRDQRLQKQLNQCFAVIEGLQREWKVDDMRYQVEMIDEQNDSLVARKIGKRRSSVWKKRRSDHILEYQIMKELVFDAISKERR